jgi:hypothetical protein
MDLQKSEQQDSKKLTMDQIFDKALRENAEQLLKDLDNPYKQGGGNASQKSRDEYRALLEKQVKIKREEDAAEMMRNLNRRFEEIKEERKNKPFSFSEGSSDNFNYQAAAIRRKNQAEIKRLRYELNSINEEANYTTGMIKKTKYKILIKKEQLNDSKKISDLFTFLFIVCALILYVGSKKNYS